MVQHFLTIFVITFDDSGRLKIHTDNIVFHMLPTPTRAILPTAQSVGEWYGHFLKNRYVIKPIYI